MVVFSGTCKQKFERKIWLKKCLLFFINVRVICADSTRSYFIVVL